MFDCRRVQPLIDGWMFRLVFLVSSKIDLSVEM